MSAVGDARKRLEETRADWPAGGPALEVAQFNDAIPVGTPVLYWPGARTGQGRPSVTRSRAWVLGDHTPVVMVEGYGGGIALTHVCPVPPAPNEAKA